MPSASDYQRDLMRHWFGGEGIDDGPPLAFLLARGWKDFGGLLVKPTFSHTVSAYEYECCAFLRDEWDYDFQTPGFFFTDVYDDADIEKEPRPPS